MGTEAAASCADSLHKSSFSSCSDVIIRVPYPVWQYPVTDTFWRDFLFFCNLDSFQRKAGKCDTLSVKGDTRGVYGLSGPTLETPTTTQHSWIAEFNLSLASLFSKQNPSKGSRHLGWFPGSIHGTDLYINTLGYGPCMRIPDLIFCLLLTILHYLHKGSS